MSSDGPPDRGDRIVSAEGQSVYYDADRGTYHARHDGSEPIATTLVLAVSSVVDEDPYDLDLLAEHVDPDALNAMVAHWSGGHPGPDAAITFTYAGCSVTVSADGEVVIDPRDENAVPA